MSRPRNWPVKIRSPKYRKSPLISWSACIFLNIASIDSKLSENVYTIIMYHLNQKKLPDPTKEALFGSGRAKIRPENRPERHLADNTLSSCVFICRCPQFGPLVPSKLPLPCVFLPRNLFLAPSCILIWAHSLPFICRRTWITHFPVKSIAEIGN